MKIKQKVLKEKPLLKKGVLSPKEINYRTREYRKSKMARMIDRKVRKVGNSYVLTIPMDFIMRNRIKEGDYILTFFMLDV